MKLRAHGRVYAPWRRLLGDRKVFRQVQGVGLWMPWSHRLPDYAEVVPEYGQNLVELAVLLGADASEPLQLLDVGANIGDSTMQILARVDARVLAVEADPYYLEYLRLNVGDGADVTVAPVLLTTSEDSDVTWAPSRRGGTTHFRERVADSSASGRVEAHGSLPIGRLREVYPDFESVRLIKSDTDGYDCRLVPELAEAYGASRPVLFFEYDPPLTQKVSGASADQVWPALAELGYDRVGFWSHAGAPLGTTTTDAAGPFAAGLLADPDRSAAYLDAVAVHVEDPIGQRALEALFDVPLDGD